MSILLAAIAVLLAIVTLVVAVAGIAIALVSIWGVKGLRVEAQKKADEAVKVKIAEYPAASDFLGVYKDMKKQLATSRREARIMQQRSEAANAILIRLVAAEESKPLDEVEDEPKAADPGAISDSYPGEVDAQ